MYPGGFLDLQAGGVVTNIGTGNGASMFSIQGRCKISGAFDANGNKQAYLADGEGQTGTLEIVTGGYLRIPGFDFKSGYGNSHLIMNGGQLLIARTIYLGCTQSNPALGGGNHVWDINDGYCSGAMLTGATNSTVTINQMGGTNACSLTFRTNTVYNLIGGWSRAGNFIVNGGSIVNQSGGTNQASWEIAIGSSPGESGYYHLSGGYLTGRSLGLGRLGGQENMPNSGGSGYFTQTGGTIGWGMRISHPTGTTESVFYLQGPTNGANYLSISALGVLRGYGKWIFNAGDRFDGRIIADGYGVERTLEVQKGDWAANFSNAVDNVTTNGYYAVRKGKLILPYMHIGTAVNYFRTNNVGETPWVSTYTGDPDIDMVNSAQLRLSSVTGSAGVTGAVYAVDRSDVPALTDKYVPISVHEFTNGAAITAATGTWTIRYNHVPVGKLVVGNDDNEAVLQVLRYNGANWVNVTGSRDAVNKRITTVSLNPPWGLFAVAVPSTKGTILYVR